MMIDGVEETPQPLPEVTNLLVNPSELKYKTPMGFSDEEIEELTRRGLMEIYTYYGKSEALVIRARVLNTVGNYAIENGYTPFSQEIVDKVTLKWVEDLQKGRIVSIVRILEKILLTI